MIYRSPAARFQRHTSEPCKTSQTLLDLYLRFQDSKCQDPRDKVFGLHSLAKTCCRAGTLIDYSKTATHSCGQLLKHHFLSHGALLGILNVVRVSEFACQVLEDYPHSRELVIADEVEVDEETATALGNIRGPITFLNPSLETLFDFTLEDIISNDYQASTKSPAKHTGVNEKMPEVETSGNSGHQVLHNNYGRRKTGIPSDYLP
jgi:hypothetical protein